MKVHTDTDSKKNLKNNEGFLFIDMITPSDIAFVISILKNGCNVWDQTMKIKTVVCRGAWRKGNKIMTIVYWKERKEN
jgi:hypothetical protein